jgi:sialic acid synthase SpsE
MVAAIREAERENRDSTIKKLVSLFGIDKVEATLGNGKKNLASSEEANYNRTNRSLHATHAIRRGQRIGKEDLAILRTEKILRPGLHPRYLAELTGRIAAKDIPDGEGITWQDVGGFH